VGHVHCGTVHRPNREGRHRVLPGQGLHSGSGVHGERRHAEGGRAARPGARNGRRKSSQVHEVHSEFDEAGEAARRSTMIKHQHRENYRHCLAIISQFLNSE